MKRLGALALVLATACSERPSRPAPSVEEIAGPSRLRGTLLIHDDSSMVFIACGTVTERVVNAPPSSQLATAIVAVNQAVRDSLWVEFVADTAGVITVRETLFAASLVEGSRCDLPVRRFDFEALGAEPFWRVTLDSAQLILERPEPPLELVFDALPPDTRGTLTTIQARRTLGAVRTLKLGLLRETCRDIMSDAWYPYRAEVRVGDLALHGCARR